MRRPPRRAGEGRGWTTELRLIRCCTALGALKESRPVRPSPEVISERRSAPRLERLQFLAQCGDRGLECRDPLAESRRPRRRRS